MAEALALAQQALDPTQAMHWQWPQPLKENGVWLTQYIKWNRAHTRRQDRQLTTLTPTAPSRTLQHTLQTPAVLVAFHW